MRHATVGTGTPCPECGKPRHIYFKRNNQGTPIAYSMCNLKECIRRRQAKNAVDRAARVAAMLEAARPLPEPEPEKPRKPKVKLSPSWLARRDYWRVFPRRLYWRATI